MLSNELFSDSFSKTITVQYVVCFEHFFVKLILPGECVTFMIEDKFPNKIGTLANSVKFQSISRKNTQYLAIFGLKFRQIGDLLDRYLNSSSISSTLYFSSENRTLILSHNDCTQICCQPQLET